MCYFSSSFLLREEATLNEDKSDMDLEIQYRMVATDTAVYIDARNSQSNLDSSLPIKFNEMC